MALGSYGGMSPDKSTGGGEYGGQSGGGENSGGIYDGLLSADGIANTGWQQTSGTEKDLGGTDNRDLDISPSLGETRLTEKTTIFNTAKLTGVDIEKVNALKNEGKTLVTSANGEVGYWGDSGYTSVVKGESVNTIASDTGIGAGSLRSLVDENGKPLSTDAANLVATKFREAYDSYIEKGMSVEAARARASYALGVGLSDGKSAPSRDNGLAYGERIGGSIFINSKGETVNTLNVNDTRKQTDPSLLPLEIARMSEQEYEDFATKAQWAYQSGDIDFQTYNKITGKAGLSDAQMKTLDLSNDQIQQAIDSYAVKNGVDVATARLHVTGLFQADALHRERMKNDSTYNAIANTVGFVGNPVNALKLVTASFGGTQGITDLVKSVGGYNPYTTQYKVDDKTGAVTWNNNPNAITTSPSSASPIDTMNSADLSNVDNTTKTSSSTDAVGAATPVDTPVATTARQNSSFSLPFLAFEAPKGAFYRGERTGAQYVGSMDLTTGFKPPEVTTPPTTAVTPKTVTTPPTATTATPKTVTTPPTATTATPKTVTTPTNTTPTTTTAAPNTGANLGVMSGGVGDTSTNRAGYNPTSVAAPAPVVTTPPPSGLMTPPAATTTPSALTLEEYKQALRNLKEETLLRKTDTYLQSIVNNINKDSASIKTWRSRV